MSDEVGQAAPESCVRARHGFGALAGKGGMPSEGIDMARILLVLRVEGLKSAETVVGRYDLLDDFFRHHPLEGGRQGFLALNVLDHDLLVKEQRAVKLLEMQE